MFFGFVDKVRLLEVVTISTGFAEAILVQIANKTGKFARLENNTMHGIIDKAALLQIIS